MTHSGPASPSATLAPIIEQVRTAAAAQQALHIVGGGSKAFLRSGLVGESLQLGAHAGIVSYEPTELVITAKAGTRVAEIEALLADNDQMLAFEPPHYNAESTIGGAVSCGLSGPARPYRGSVRDYVLGVELVTGRGQTLRFGGQVMKNVAGYDISRLVTGAYGILGVITEVSLRVVPRTRRETTLAWSMSADAGRARMLELAHQPWPITAMAADASNLRIRISGSDEAVDDAIAHLQPQSCIEGDAYWTQLRDLSLPPQRHPGEDSLWRMSLPPAAPDPGFVGAKSGVLYDWGGAQRWLWCSDGTGVREHCLRHGGHATCMRRALGDATAAFTPPAVNVQAVMMRIRSSFDPNGIFNPGNYFEWAE